MGLEETSWAFAVLVALLTLLSSVWYTSASVNNKNRDLEYMMEELVVIKDSLSSITLSLSERESRLEDVDRILKETLRERVKLLYINTDHILLETHDGRVVKLPMLAK